MLLLLLLERCQIVFISAIFFFFFISPGLFHPCIPFLLFLSCVGPVQIFCLPTTPCSMSKENRKPSYTDQLRSSKTTRNPPADPLTSQAALMEKEGTTMTSATQDATSMVGVDFMQQMMQVVAAEMGKVMVTIKEGEERTRKEAVEREEFRVAQAKEEERQRAKENRERERMLTAEMERKEKEEVRGG